MNPLSFPCFLLLLALLLTGCNTVPEQSRFYHASSEWEAMARVATWMSQPGHSWSHVGWKTNSMWPALRGHEITLQLKYRPGALLPQGQMVVFDRRDVPNVLHRVLSFHPDGAYISGDNCRYSDGWIPLERIKFVVVEVISFPPSSPVAVRPTASAP